MKKLKILIISFILCMVFGITNVSATTVTIDPNNYITMPNYLFSDKDTQFTISGITTYQSYYQIQDVSSNTSLVAKIDALITAQVQYKQSSDLYASSTDETIKAQAAASMNTIEANINTLKDQIKELVDNYDSSESAWTTATNNIIPSTNITNKLYYIVWVKVTNEGNSYYEYYPYKAILDGEEANIEKTINPATGISTDILYIGVGLLIVIGSYLVINKNKERYE